MFVNVHHFDAIDILIVLSHFVIEIADSRLEGTIPGGTDATRDLRFRLLEIAVARLSPPIERLESLVLPVGDSFCPEAVVLRHRFRISQNFFPYLMVRFWHQLFQFLFSACLQFDSFLSEAHWA